MCFRTLSDSAPSVPLLKVLNAFSTLFKSTEAFMVDPLLELVLGRPVGGCGGG